MTEPFSDLAPRLAILSSGLFLVTGILTGGWKYYHVRSGPDHRAPAYVNIAHQAALAYAFSSLVVGALAFLSAWPDWVNTTAVAITLYQFIFATAAYVVHGFDRSMKNQFAPPHRMGRMAMPSGLVHGSMLVLFVCELGGVLTLLSGAVVAQF